MAERSSPFGKRAAQSVCLCFLCIIYISDLVIFNVCFDLIVPAPCHVLPFTLDMKSITFIYCINNRVGHNVQY